MTVESITSDELRTKAKDLGIKFTKNTDDDTLIAKIEAIETSASRVQSRNVQNSRQQLTALKHVKVTPLNPVEFNQKAKYVSLVNRFVSIRKAVLFNEPIFLEQCIIDSLKSKKFINVITNVNGKGKQGSERPRTELKPAYGITELHTPTEEEWNNGAEWKAMREDKKMRDAALEGGKQ